MKIERNGVTNGGEITNQETTHLFLKGNVRLNIEYIIMTIRRHNKLNSSQY